jgi:hypothetical protein
MPESRCSEKITDFALFDRVREKVGKIRKQELSVQVQQ